MTTLIFDTETTGLVNAKIDPRDPRQPKAVQLGMKLDDQRRIERGAANVMIKPRGWIVHPRAAQVTGLDETIAEAFGIDLITAVEMFLDWAEIADTLVAHNAIFDVTVMRQMVHIWSEITGAAYFDPFEGKTVVCTMLATTPILKLLPKRFGDYKWPKLVECVRYFWNEDLDGAHDALVDVRACSHVYYHLVDIGAFTAEALDAALIKTAA